MFDKLDSLNLKALLEVAKKNLEVNEEILGVLTRPQLTTIHIAFYRKRRHHMPPVQGPITLTESGQTATATVLGFDQFGNPWTGTIPPVTYTIDPPDESVVTSEPNDDELTDLITAVDDGVANLTAGLTTVEGKNLSDNETITVAITPPPTPVLSSIKVAFDQE